MNEQLVDLSFLEELSGGDPKYKYDVLRLFLGSVDEGIASLEQLVNTMKDMEAIYKQAHALKSPTGIIRVDNMREQFARIEELGRSATGEEEIKQLMENLLSVYGRARPILVEEMERNKPAE